MNKIFLIWFFDVRVVIGLFDYFEWVLVKLLYLKIVLVNLIFLIFINLLMKKNILLI